MAYDRLFSGLHVLDMANSHEGSLEHGLKIIDECAAVVKKHGVKATVKFQYRDLDTIIHPAYEDRTDIKHIPRFLGNRLPWEAFATMLDRVREHGMVTMVTPSDEYSVDKCLEHNVAILKVPSPAVNDWPLLEKIAAAGRPVIVSTGGVQLHEIDDVTSFFMHKKVRFALMHCVSIYPTENQQANMNFMRRLIRRYPNLVIGYSGHEGPDNVDIGKAAIAAGAQMMERHVGIGLPERPLNKYSMNPPQVDTWLSALELARSIGGSEDDKPVSEQEKADVRSLQRGVWAKREIKKGETLKREDVFFAMPMQEGQITSGEFGKYRAIYTASRDYAENESIVEQIAEPDDVKKVRTIVHEIRGMLQEANVEPGDSVEIELSHHFGMDRYREVGAALVNVLNREYCKKIIVVLPGQSHPEHMHKVKEEAFHLLWGELTLNRDGQDEHLKSGDVAIIERGTWHSFKTDKGAIFEEVSTTHVKGDSYYKDLAIAKLDVKERKTVVENW